MRSPIFAPISLILLLNYSAWGEDGQFGGKSESRFLKSYEELGEFRYFENWTDLSYTKDAYRFDLGYEAHLPPIPPSRDTIGQGIYTRSFKYSDSLFVFKVGNIYSRFGNGLTLVAQQNRDIGLNSNIDGVYAEYLGEIVSAKVLAGSPRDPTGKRAPIVQGGDLRLPVLTTSFLGLTYLTTKTSVDANDYWGSLYAGYSGDLGSFQVEWAARRFFQDPFLHQVASDFDSVFTNGKALYGAATVPIGDLTLFAEGLYYQKFNLSDGAIYNSPPSGIHENIFSLPNKHQLVQNSDDEKGYHLSLSYPVILENILTLEYVKITNIAGNYDLYKEIYGQLEIISAPMVSGFIASAYQSDVEGENYTFILHPTIPIQSNFSILAEWQHQLSKISLTDRMFYSQQYLVSLEYSPDLVISLLAETTTDQLEKSDLNLGESKIWAGIQANYHFLNRNDISFFGGTRKKGKVCAGGVCILKPELKGFEITLNTRI